jgi:hypothetical protein
MWVPCPFNGPATSIKVGFASIALQGVGRHVGDWERISNFSGERVGSWTLVIWSSSLETKRLFICGEMGMQAIPILGAI